MLRSLICLLMALQQLSTPLSTPEGRVILAAKSGILLRTHVVAQDDTEEMQRVKLVVRDAVQEAYSANRPEPRASMLAAAEAALPLLTEAAVSAARREGFAGEVSVSIALETFDARELDGFTLPAGKYPALMIRLGDAQGHNWWGLIDPELSLRLAMVSAEAPADGAVEWDWSLKALLYALLGLPMAQEVDDA